MVSPQATNATLASMKEALATADATVAALEKEQVHTPRRVYCALVFWQNSSTILTQHEWWTYLSYFYFIFSLTKNMYFDVAG